MSKSNGKSDTTEILVIVDDYILQPNFKVISYSFIPEITDFWRRQEWRYEYDKYNVNFKFQIDKDKKLDCEYLSKIINTLEECYFKVKNSVNYGLTNTEKLFYESQLDTYMYHVDIESFKDSSIDNIFKNYRSSFTTIDDVYKIVKKAY
jgi:hypothetical protein